MYVLGKHREGLWRVRAVACKQVLQTMSKSLSDFSELLPFFALICSEGDGDGVTKKCTEKCTDVSFLDLFSHFSTHFLII